MSPARPIRLASLGLTTLVLAIALSGCESAAVSHTVQIAEQPTWTAGEFWTYRGRRNGAAYTITRKVLREGLFQGRPAYEIEAGDSHYWYTEKLGYLAKTVGGRTVRQASPPEDWQWPLQVGKTWSATVTWTDAGDPDRQFVLTSVWTVEAYEDVKTPAGSFKAFKVSRRELESGASQEFWFSPAVGGWVKLDGRQTADGNYEEELTATTPR